ncbi:MAG: F0F1 ATP synthase subunit A, partial [Firmicutes bacterium]|nr:F0F1 ATP synthase subunit A [Bacillota bacterium]
ANHGPKFFLHLFKPFAFLFPIMLIEQFVRPLSLTLRLYGNIYGEEAVVHAFFDLIPIGLPVVMQFLSVLMGLVQALVFSLLSSIYISEAVETAEHL